MHNSGYKSALARRVCRYSDARPPRKTDGVLLESEIPPRMRGKISRVRDDLARVGITPAYAGKSRAKKAVAAVRRDHPRICGEKRISSTALWYAVGSPPHMRGKDSENRFAENPQGITPAYAGKSLSLCLVRRFRGDHPRICGEKAADRCGPRRVSGSPPHMRGKAASVHFCCAGAGITPAYAGKSASNVSLMSWSRDHPRICGEKYHKAMGIRNPQGSPPHMRGKEEQCIRRFAPTGITPAYAGKRLLGALSRLSRRDHPRICGEKTKKIP